jgi:hypothetical protein
LRATVKLKQAGREQWRVSVVRGGQVTSSVVRGWTRASALAWRTVALLGHWDALRESEPVLEEQRRYVVIDASYPSEDPPLPGGHEGQVLASFRSLERAIAFADEELLAGNPDVMVIDRASGTRVFPRERMDSSVRPSVPPPGEAASM